MTYDVRAKREQTLKDINRNAVNKIIIVLIALLIYIGISLAGFHKNNTDISVSNVITKHFFDAMVWNHDVRSVKGDRG